MKLGEVAPQTLRKQLAAEGIGLQFGAFQFRLQSRIGLISDAVQILYAEHPFAPPAIFSDFRLLLEPKLKHGWPGVAGIVNGETWHVWPRRLTVAALEWICSWCFFRGATRQLAVHAAAATLPGTEQALIFPGASGAGKSTLASTLMLSDWGLLSDEIALFNLDDGLVTALGRPSILKGESLELIKSRYGNAASFGPRGRMLEPRVAVAHLSPTAASVEMRGRSFPPVAIVFPRRADRAQPQLDSLSPGEAFAKLSQFGINYRSLGREGFDRAVSLAQSCPAYQLVYDDAAEAERFLRKQSWTRADAVPPVAASAPKLRPPIPRRAESSNSSAEAMRPTPRQLLTTLIDALRSPHKLSNLDLATWDELIPLAQQSSLLPQLAVSVMRHRVAGELDPAVRERLALEVRLSEFNRRGLAVELRHLSAALREYAGPVVLLKGAAYHQADFPWSRGRRTNDVDLLVSETSLEQAQQALALGGYAALEKLSAADQSYYRRWLHELAPVRHPYRRLEIDLHFRLLPQFDIKSFSAEPLIERSLPLTGSAFRMLDPIDRVIHSAVNFARTGELERPLRDLWDLRCMIDDAHDHFDWEELAQRACGLRLGNCLAMVLLLANEYVELPVPASVLELLSGSSAVRLRRRTLYRLMSLAICPTTPAEETRRRKFAHWAVGRYPPPRLRTWIDPLTWTKRIRFLREP